METLLIYLVPLLYGGVCAGIYLVGHHLGYRRGYADCMIEAVRSRLDSFAESEQGDEPPRRGGAEGLAQSSPLTAQSS